MSRSARFRELLKKPPFVCMGAHDAVTAKLAEQAGAPAIYVSGFVASAIVAGAPDFGVLTQTEMFEHIRRICRVTTVPVFADADTGYGGALDAQRTIQALGRSRRLRAALGRSSHAEEVRALRRQAADSVPRRCNRSCARCSRRAAIPTSSSSRARTRWASRISTTRFAGSKVCGRRRRRAIRRRAAQRRAAEGNRAAPEAARPAAAVQHGSLRQEPVFRSKRSTSSASTTRSAPSSRCSRCTRPSRR